MKVILAAFIILIIMIEKIKGSSFKSTPKLYGFRCDHSGHHSYSPSSDPTTCSSKLPEFTTSVQGTGSLLYDNSQSTLNAVICERTTVSTFKYCSFMRYTYLRDDVPQNMFPEATGLSISACRDLVEGKTVVVDSMPITFGIEDTITARLDHHLAADGWCTPYKTNFQEVVTTISRRPMTLNISFDSVSGQPILTSLGGLGLTDIGKGSGMLNSIWPVIWDDSQLPAHRFSSVYEGNVSIYSSIANETVIAIASRAAAFQLEQEIALQNLKVYQTSLPGLYWTEKLVSQDLPFNINYHIDLLDLTLAGEGFIKTSLAEGLGSMQRSTLVEICALREEILRNLRMQLSSPPHSHSGLILKEKGIKLMMAGEAIVSTPCSQVGVFIRPELNCFNKIPISVPSLNLSLFLSPDSREIVDYASSVPCTDAYLPNLDINGTLVRFSPDLEYVETGQFPLISSYTHFEFKTDLRSHLYPIDYLKGTRVPDPYPMVEEKIRLSLLNKVKTDYGQQHYDIEHNNKAFVFGSSIGVGSVIGLIGLISVIAYCVRRYFRSRRSRQSSNPNQVKVIFNQQLIESSSSPLSNKEKENNDDDYNLDWRSIP